MSMTSWQDCTTAAEVVKRGREARARIRAQRIIPKLAPKSEPSAPLLVDITASDFLVIPELEPPRVITLKHIASEVQLACGVSHLAIRSKYRNAPLVTARAIFMSLARKYTRKSLSMIGQFVHKDHSSVIKCIATLERRRVTNARLQATLDQLEADLIAWRDRI